MPKLGTAPHSLPHGISPSIVMKAPAPTAWVSGPALSPIQIKFYPTHPSPLLVVPLPLGIALIQKCAPSTTLSDAKFQPT